MRLPDFQYIEPDSLEDAIIFLKEHAGFSKINAGGTDLLPSMKQRVFTPKYLVNLGNLQDLDSIEFDEKTGLEIGALVRLRTLEKDPLIRDRYPIIRDAASMIAAGQLRQMGTVGGNLCLDSRCYYYNQSVFWRNCRPTCLKMGGDTCNAVGGGKKCFAVFSGDLAPAMIALDAKVIILSPEGERAMALDDLYTGDGARPVSLGPDEILVRIEVPPMEPHVFSAYMKYRIRKSIDFPLAGVAARIDIDKKDKICREAKVVINGVGPRPQILEDISERLEGNKLGGQLIEAVSEMAYKAAKPVANTAGSPSYRRFMVKIYVKRALEQAMENAA